MSSTRIPAFGIEHIVEYSRSVPSALLSICWRTFLSIEGCFQELLLIFFVRACDSCENMRLYRMGFCEKGAPKKCSLATFDAVFTFSSVCDFLRLEIVRLS